MIIETDVSWDNHCENSLAVLAAVIRVPCERLITFKRIKVEETTSIDILELKAIRFGLDKAFFFKKLYNTHSLKFLSDNLTAIEWINDDDKYLRYVKKQSILSKQMKAQADYIRTKIGYWKQGYYKNQAEFICVDRKKVVEAHIVAKIVRKKEEFLFPDIFRAYKTLPEKD